MNTRIVEDRLKNYRANSAEAEAQALREITQELIVFSLSTSDFFSQAAFQGGTCLRMIHGLNRFSEDLDFIARKSDPAFCWEPHLTLIATRLEQYGYHVELQDKSHSGDAVKKAFIKDDSIGKIIRLAYAQRQGPTRKIKIKLEIDTNPPAGGEFETRYVNFPTVSSITTETMPTLLAGKCHALLCRRFEKGRDWYDFLWYLARKTPLNYTRLAASLNQSGPWQGQGLAISRNSFITMMKERISSTDWKRAAADVAPFLAQEELPALSTWGTELFIAALDWLP